MNHSTNVVAISSALSKPKTPSNAAEIAALVGKIQKIQTRCAFDIHTKIVDIERRLKQLGVCANVR